MVDYTTYLNMPDPTEAADSDVWGGYWRTSLMTVDSHLQGLIFGLTLSAAGSTATFGIAAGVASGMALATAFTKTTSAWGVGTGQGALDTGAIANSSWYSVFLIQRPDTGVVDVLVSLSASAPTLPTNYTRKRRIGSMKTDGSAQWLKFVQLGDEFLWGTPITTGAVSPATNTPTLYAVGSPTGVQMVSRLRVLYGAGASAGDSVLIQSPDETSANPGAVVGNFTVRVEVNNTYNSANVDVRTDTFGQVRAISTNGTATLAISCYGWFDRRGQ